MSKLELGPAALVDLLIWDQVPPNSLPLYEIDPPVDDSYPLIIVSKTGFDVISEPASPALYDLPMMDAASFRINFKAALEETVRLAQVDQYLLEHVSYFYGRENWMPIGSRDPARSYGSGYQLDLDPVTVFATIKDQEFRGVLAEQNGLYGAIIATRSFAKWCGEYEESVP